MKTNQLLFGAAYYDEYMPYDRIDLDMKLMKDAGMNVIRIAESTWSTWEPSDGVFDFTHLDRMMDASLQYGISVIIGTPTYAIPSWLAKKYPDILAVTNQGPGIYGHRQNMDITHPGYLFHAERIIRTMLTHLKSRTNIIGYQLDNETKSYGTAGERVQAMFVRYLKEQFPDLNAFNLEFGLNYWSNRISSWDDFPDIRGTINGSLGAEFQKFQRKLVTQFLGWQADIVKEYANSSQFITQNFDYDWRDYSFGIQPEVDQFQAAKSLTVAGVDIYHPSQHKLTGAEIAFGGTVGRSIKNGNYLVLETQAQGNISWLPFEGQLRLQAFSHIASGSNSVMYWNWHSIHNSFETYWKGVLSHDLSINPTYLEAVTIGKEFNTYGTSLMNLSKCNKVAIMVSNEALTGMKWFEINSLFGYNDVLRWLFDALYFLNVECDFIHYSSDQLNNYNMLLVPALYSAPEQVLHNLNSYVEQGGHLIATFKSGFCDEHLKVYPTLQPHIISECLGITYSQFTIPEQVGLDIHPSSKAEHFMELVTPTCADTVSYYTEPHYAAYSAVTHNHYGKGTAVYLSCYFDAKSLETVLIPLLKEAAIPISQNHFPVIVKKGINEQGIQIVYYFNYSDNRQEILIEHNSRCLFSKNSYQKETSLSLNPWDFLIMEVVD